MPINAHPEYLAAEKEYLFAKTIEEKITALQKMISVCPAHKGAENLRAELKTRLKKFVEKKEKSKKTGKSSKQGIKKSDVQVVLAGFANSGKTSVFNVLTNLDKKASDFPYSTKEPQQGMLNYEGIKIQIIDMPSFPNEDKSIINSADTIMIIADSLDQINNSKQFVKNPVAKRIIIFSKSDILDEIQKRKITETLKAKKYNFILFSSLNKENLDELKKKIFETFSITRIYTKEPKKPASSEAMILKQNSSVKDVAEKILKKFSEKIKQTKIWGPSSKFPGQTVGLNHILKDKDVVEFRTE